MHVSFYLHFSQCSFCNPFQAHHKNLLMPMKGLVNCECMSVVHHCYSYLSAHCLSPVTSLSYYPKEDTTLDSVSKIKHSYM